MVFRYFVSLLLALVPQTPAQTAPPRISWVTEDDPPLLLIHGLKDTTVPFDQSVRTEAAYRKAGIPVELIPVRNAEHNFRPVDHAKIDPTQPGIIARSVAFFEKVLARIQ